MARTVKFFPILTEAHRHWVDVPVGSQVVSVEYRPVRVLGLNVLHRVDNLTRPYELYLVCEGEAIPADGQYIGQFHREDDPRLWHVFSKHFQLKL